MDDRTEIQAVGRTVAEFLTGQEALKQIYLERDKFAFFYFNGGIINATQGQMSPQYNVFINIAFKAKDEINESDEDKLIDINTDGFFKSASFENIVKTICLVSTSGKISSKTDDPSLLLVSSEVKMGMTLEYKNTATNNLIINAIVVDAANFDSIQRKTISPENLPNIQRNI